MSAPRRSPISERDARLLVGFAFFAEVVLGWFFLVDPPLTRLGRLERDLAGAVAARDALRAAAPAVAPGPAVPGDEKEAPLPAPLKPARQETPALVVQRHVAELAAKAGVTPVSVAMAQGGSEVPAGARRVDVVVSGPFDAVERFVGALAWPEVREGVERLVLAADGAKGEAMRAEARLLVGIEGAPALPSSGAEPTPTPGP